MKYGLLAVNAAEKNNDTTIQLATIYNRIGSTYGQTKKFDEAYNYYQKAIAIAEKYHDGETYDLLISNLSRTLVALHRANEAITVLKNAEKKYPFTDIYLQLYYAGSYLIAYETLKEYDKAQTYCNQLLFISKKLEKNEPDQSEAQYPVTEFYLATHQYELARKHLAATDTFYKLIESPLELYKNHLLWFKLDSIQGNYSDAIYHYQRYKMLSDSLMNETTSHHIEQLQIEYETEKKDNNIQLLENNNKLQQDKLSQAKTTQQWMISVAVLLLIITGLFVYNARLKQRSNKQLKVQQKEIEQKNIALQHLVEEKDWLVKEIHHRVKNNFHTVAGLLATQSEYLKTDEAIEAMNESRHRIQAMALIHQKLYQSENLSAISMPGYINELIDYLRDCFNTPKSLQFNVQAEPVALDVSHSVPIGLILNEAITNSIKYAFPNNKNGVINISLKHVKANNLLLSITDNGIGLPQHFDSINAKSMGMKLMRGLSEDIDGKFVINSNEGTRITVEFGYDI